MRSPAVWVGLVAVAGCALDAGGLGTDRRDLVVVPASSETERLVGVAEWRIDPRAASTVVVGYDARGDAAGDAAIEYDAEERAVGLTVSLARVTSAWFAPGPAAGADVGDDPRARRFLEALARDLGGIVPSWDAPTAPSEIPSPPEGGKTCALAALDALAACPAMAAACWRAERAIEEGRATEIGADCLATGTGCALAANAQFDACGGERPPIALAGGAAAEAPVVSDDMDRRSNDEPPPPPFDSGGRSP